MDKACLSLFKLKGYVDCLQYLKLTPTLRISTHPVFNRSSFPEIPQTNGLTLPEEYQDADILDIRIGDINQVSYEFSYGVIDVKYSDKFFSIPIEYAVAVISNEYEFVIHKEPIRFLTACALPKLKLVK